jgi:heterodisulfide reductase subunit A-like polyferredoxin
MKCTTVCNFDAIHVDNFLAKIDPAKCKSCGLCAAICPVGAINSFKKLPSKEQAEKVAAAKKAKAAAAKAAAKA